MLFSQKVYRNKRNSETPTPLIYVRQSYRSTIGYGSEGSEQLGVPSAGVVPAISLGSLV